MTLAHKRWGRAARIVELNATKIQDDDPLFPDWLRFCAIEGDRKAQVEFVRRASSGDYEYVRLFLLIARRLEPQITSQISLDGVVAHEYSSKELLDIAQGLCGETGRGMRDGRADVRLPVDEEILEHFSSDALDAFYEKLLKFASDMKPGADRIRAFMYAFQLASKTDEHDALNKVLAEVDTALRSSVDQETAKAVEDALSRMRTEQIPKDIPERIAMVCGNWSLIMDQIIKDPGIDALRALLELQSRIPQQRQQHLEDRIKSMSIRIGVKVLRRGNRLALSAQI